MRKKKTLGVFQESIIDREEHQHLGQQTASLINSTPHQQLDNSFIVRHLQLQHVIKTILPSKLINTHRKGVWKNNPPDFAATAVAVKMLEVVTPL
ncbi:hypothetical protein PoB_006445800 [Plakobranchus ocellatus]|uniref:Uncharacterized protein n=1 Tax=Plakobranchus ocellatus TaxID=259542 RepID=A0AAV4D1E0_9GAST|nr:hypothetical protein PoB_006445800 [Plakobranchus ocellatus]